MKQIRLGHLVGALLAVMMLGTTACQSNHKLTSVEGKLIALDSTYDTSYDNAVYEVIKPYKNTIDSIMERVIGYSEKTMPPGAPESLLSNLVADILREAATDVIGKPADMGLVNMGGLRNILNEGPITTGNIYEILPFENSLCVVTVNGKVLNALFEAIAARGGNGVSGVKLVISPERKLISATIDGKPVQADKLYTIATIDYLAEGNDGMNPLADAQKCDCPAGATLRNVVMEYIENQTKAGKNITSNIEGRVTVQK